MALPDDAHIGSVSLTVRNLERSVAFYRDVLGFRVDKRTDVAAALSADGTRTLIELHEHTDAVLRPRRCTGLFHFAILVPNRAALGRSLQHLVEQDWPLTGVADHLVSEALYLNDPDGLGIEIYRDRPRDTWKRVDGQIAMATDPLDLQSVANEPGAELPWTGLEAGTVIGHCTPARRVAGRRRAAVLRHCRVRADGAHLSRRAVRGGGRLPSSRWAEHLGGRGRAAAAGECGRSALVQRARGVAGGGRSGRRSVTSRSVGGVWNVGHPFMGCRGKMPSFPSSAINWTIRVAVVLALSASLSAQDTEREIERVASEGWRAARTLAPIGAPRDRLGPVNQSLERLDALIINVAARYADAAIRAAIAAAQEERDEMAVFLEHARALSVQMALTGAPARWPLPIDELEGELWFEVDRFTEARDAYQRATTTAPSARAWLGLARASARLDDMAAACAAYKAISPATVSESDKTEIAVYLLRCRN